MKRRRSTTTTSHSLSLSKRQKRNNVFIDEIRKHNGDRNLSRMVDNTIDDISKALECACKAGNQDMLEILYGYKLFDSHDIDNAVSGGHYHLVEYILESGVRKYDESDMSHACGIGDVTLVNIFRRYCKKHNIKRNGDNLIYACKRGHVEIVKMLLKDGYDPDGSFTSRHSRPIIHAINNGHADVVRLLLAAGASNAARSRAYESPLYISYRRGNRDVVKALLDRGADITHTLVNACRDGDIDIVKMLLATGSQCYNRPYLRDTNCLKIAYLKGHIDICYLLLAAGRHTKYALPGLMRDVQQYVISMLKPIGLPDVLARNIVLPFILGGCDVS